jgi:REP element-mobilizing transposase RayT
VTRHPHTSRRPARGRRSSPPQLGLALSPRHDWGGRRDGAGRKRRAGARLPHSTREPVRRNHPVHATVRVRGDVPSLRRKALHAIVQAALRAVLGRDGFSAVHFSVQSNHVHLLVESAGADALARGMQALSIRIAKQTNRLLGRRGAVLSDRYHARALRTPREVRNALCYVLQNHRRHAAAEAARSGAIFAPGWVDPCSSGAAFDGWAGEISGAGVPHSLGARARAVQQRPPVAAARCWLLTVGWRRHGLVSVDEVPTAAWA